MGKVKELLLFKVFARWGASKLRLLINSDV